MNTKLKLKQIFRKDGMADQIVALVLTVGLIWWALSALFGGNSCEKAREHLEHTQSDEQEKLEEAKSGGDSMSHARAIQRRMYAEQDVAQACNK